MTLMIETLNNGKRIVRLHRDWHPGRIGLGYVKYQKNHLDRDASRLQGALLFIKPNAKTR